MGGSAKIAIDIGAKGANGGFEGNLFASDEAMKPDRNHEIISLFNDGKTLQEIGDKFFITRERVRQIVKRFGAESRWTQKAAREEKIICELARFDGGKEEFMQRVGITPESLSYLTYKNGIKPPRSNAWHERRRKADKVIALWKEGKGNINSLCNGDQVFSHFVRRYIKELGIITSTGIVRNSKIVFVAESPK